jgi:hypothetical protein
MDEVALLRDLYTATVTGILLGVVFALVLRDLETRGKELVLPKPVYVVALLICVALALFGQSKLVAALSDRYLTIGFVGACTLLMWVGVWLLTRPLYVKDGIKHGAIAYSVGLFLTSGGFVFALGTGPQDSIRIMQYGTLILGISMPIAVYWLSMTYKIGKAVSAASQ